MRNSIICHLSVLILASIAFLPTGYLAAHGDIDPRGIMKTYGPIIASDTVPQNNLNELAPSTSCNDGWLDGIPVNGVDGWFEAIAFGGDGSVYVGGYFTVAGNTVANNIAKWDGPSWSALGTGTNRGISAIAVSGNDVVVGGGFTTAGGTPANNIAKWNGSSWSPIGSGLEFSVDDIEISGTNVYAVQNEPVNPGSGIWRGNVARWNGTSWQNLGSGMDGVVSEIAVSGSEVYALGGFTEAGGTPAEHIAKWDGSSWSPLGTGPNGSMDTIAASGSDVYVGGSRESGGARTGFVAKWNGSAWSDVGSGMTGTDSYASVKAIAVSGTNVYAVGRFDSAGGTPANGFARWNGSSWSAGGPEGTSILYIRLVAVSGSEIAIWGGAQGQEFPILKKGNGSSWSTFGMTGQVSKVVAMTTSGTDVYATGYFTTDNGTTYSRAAIWNGTGWTRLGAWPRDPEWTARTVSSIAVSGTNVYVGGSWYDPGTQRNHGYIAKWNGSNWSTLVSDLGEDRFVNALAVSGSDLYVGGYFQTIGGIPANNIAKWNGSNWSALGIGTNGGVAAIAVSGNDVYVGGWFRTAGGVGVNYIAKWNGTSWSDLGYPGPSFSPLTNRPEEILPFVSDIEVSGTDLYVGGGNNQGYFDFGSAHRWNGSSWTDISPTFYSAVLTLAVSGSDIYAGGYRVLSFNNIARWNGSGWSPLGSGVNGDVTSIVARGSELFVGGNFTTAGCHVSAYFARYSWPVASVSGRVMTPDGRGLRNAVVSLSSQGISRTVTTSSFGFYSFDNVATGRTYTLGVSSKRYRFTSRVVNVDAALTNVDFVGEE